MVLESRAHWIQMSLLYLLRNTRGIRQTHWYSNVLLTLLVPNFSLLLLSCLPAILLLPINPARSINSACFLAFLASGDPTFFNNTCSITACDPKTLRKRSLYGSFISKRYHAAASQ
ncbi:uncharacterized protein ARMOST_18003 [Armillaria ostoyae]|uniref:Uncharacterized protein n=1 Tax=Armillaria ostoyae TaxID=47428 RepID=A0A284S0J7_ARMOS|nr:uncharacterized protein ARMOST_18003 [Armillaria ostoyae]